MGEEKRSIPKSNIIWVELRLLWITLLFGIISLAALLGWNNNEINGYEKILANGTFFKGKIVITNSRKYQNGLILIEESDLPRNSQSLRQQHNETAALFKKVDISNSDVLDGDSNLPTIGALVQFQLYEVGNENDKFLVAKNISLHEESVNAEINTNVNSIVEESNGLNLIHYAEYTIDNTHTYGHITGFAEDDLEIPLLDIDGNQIGSKIYKIADTINDDSGEETTIKGLFWKVIETNNFPIPLDELNGDTINYYFESNGTYTVDGVIYKKFDEVGLNHPKHWYDK